MTAPLRPLPFDSFPSVTAAILSLVNTQPRELHVVECETEAGWLPMPGDAYIERNDAERCAALSRLRTRVVVYVPKGDAT